MATQPAKPSSCQNFLALDLQLSSVCHPIATVALLAFTLVASPFGLADQITSNIDTGQTSKAKSPPKKDRAPEPVAPEKLEISGYEPLFLQKKPSSETQTIHIVGSFPKDVSLEAVSADLVPDQDQTWASDKEIFAQVALGDNAKGTVILLVKSSIGTTSISFEIRNACAKLDPPRAAVAPTTVAGWNKLCDLPPITDDKKAKHVAVTYGINALQHSSKTNPDSNFCNNSSTDVSVVDLKDTYLNTGDAARVVVCNQNPFRWATTLSRNETAIKNDDPSAFLGILDPMLGANNATKAAAGAAGSATQKSSQGTTSKPAGSNKYSLNKSLAAPQNFTFEDPVQGCINELADNISNDDKSISAFITNYNSTKVVIEDDSTECGVRKDKTIKLWCDGQELPTTHLNAIASQIASIKTEIAYRENQLGTDGNSLSQKHLKALQAQDKALDQQLCVANKLLTVATKTIPENVVTPIQKILGTNGSFVYMSTNVGRYHDPTQVTWKLSSRLKTTSGSGALPTSSTLAVSPYLECMLPSSDDSGTNGPTGKGQRNGQPNPPTPTDPITPPVKEQKKASPTPSATTQVHQTAHVETVSFAEANNDVALPNTPENPEEQSKKGAQKTKQNNPGGGANQQPPAGQQSDQTPAQSPKTGPTQEDGPQITTVFGGPQFVVSAGVAAVILRNQQFQKVQASGQTSGTTIEYSTNSLIRMSPLIMGHARLYKYKRSDRAIWATLGVTGASNNSGVSAEYFVGVSWSWLNNWVFLSPGLYIGQKQSLTAGYKVGQELPSSFTGSLPTTQNYRPGFGLTMSIRIPGTSAPKTKSTNSNSGNSKNSSNTEKTNSSD